jgi:hypothetical protein
MSQTLYIPDLVGTVVEKVNAVFSSRPANPFNVYYEFGHHEEVLRQLIYKEQNPSKPKKYPLVWLVTPFEEDRRTVGIYGVATLHFVIAFDTQNTYSMPERRDNVFLPYLYPVYHELINQLMLSKSFATAGQLPHIKTDIQYAKVTEGENLFNDFVDVVDVKNIRVQVKNIC